jgi:sirohydrochlorin ferrochelatase
VPLVSPVLLLALHGTRSIDGRGELDEIAARVRSARPGLDVALGFLDVLEPDLPTALDAINGPVVIVPALLSSGYHVTVDIPQVAARRPGVTVARHLGPDPKLSVALAERLRDVAKTWPELVALVGSGSSHAAAGDDLAGAAQDLARRIGCPVSPLTIEDDLAGQLAELRATATVAVASYLIAEGFFAAKLRAQAASAGVDVVSAPIGAHPALIALVLERYDAVVGAVDGPVDFPGAAR